MRVLLMSRSSCYLITALALLIALSSKSSSNVGPQPFGLFYSTNCALQMLSSQHHILLLLTQAIVTIFTNLSQVNERSLLSPRIVLTRLIKLHNIENIAEGTHCFNDWYSSSNSTPLRLMRFFCCRAIYSQIALSSM